MADFCDLAHESPERGNGRRAVVCAAAACRGEHATARREYQWRAQWIRSLLLTRSLSFATVLVFLFHAPIAASEFHWIGESAAGLLSGHSVLSENGSAIAGGGTVGPAFRWTRDGGLELLDFMPIAVTDLSADGSVLVGLLFEGGAFRWTEDGGLMELGMLPGAEGSWATAVSDDGSMVFGRSRYVVGSRPFRWTQEEGMVELPIPTIIYQVSSDGSVIAGTDSGHTYRWSEQTGVEFLDIPRWISISDISADGTTIIGNQRNGGSAIRWTAEEGIVELGGLAGTEWSTSFATTADGLVVVGESLYGGFVWDPVYGMRNVHSVLTEEFGLSELEDVPLEYVDDISADGRVIKGVSIDATADHYAQGWVAYLDEPINRRGSLRGDYNGNGLVEQTDLDLVLIGWGQDGQAGLPSMWTNDLPVSLIDQEELDRVLVNWGRSTESGGASTAAVPEPGTVWLFVLAAVICWRLERIIAQSDGR